MPLQLWRSKFDSYVVVFLVPNAFVRVHPYEEPAYEVYKLEDYWVRWSPYVSVAVGEEDEASRILDSAFYDRQLGCRGYGTKIWGQKCCHVLGLIPCLSARNEPVDRIYHFILASFNVLSVFWTHPTLEDWDSISNYKLPHGTSISPFIWFTYLNFCIQSTVIHRVYWARHHPTSCDYQ